ncbi:MAG: TetR family transcriptional regulator C-terminal domain-containing protein [Candidatus Manganitrophus sp.]|nr:TetR family transcriptional regulator C-terminal domain-containing protein [Candidatus Manganitrophus sp.]
MGLKGEITKRRILETACSLFYIKGYNGTSIEDILKAAKVKKGNFYFHFRSKEDLGHAVIDAYAAKTIPLLQETLRQEGNPLSRLFDLFRRQEGRMKASRYRGGCPCGNLALELADHHDGFRRQLDAIFDVWTREIMIILKQAQKEGTLEESVNPKEMAHLIVAVLEGSTLLAKTKKSGEIYRSCIKSLESLMKDPIPKESDKHIHTRRK